MDNRIFNVNGSGRERLAKVLELAFHNGHYDQKAVAWRYSQKHGLILLWCAKDGDNKFVTPLSASEVLGTIVAWLGSDQAKEVECEDWDEDTEHDGDNSLGWRVYCEDWGHVDGDWRAICAVKPAYMWHGK